MPRRVHPLLCAALIGGCGIATAQRPAPYHGDVAAIAPRPDNPIPKEVLP